jgi:hypothetical protein
MRKPITSFLLLFLFLSTVLADDSWVRVEPPGAGFVIMMPAKPVEEISQQEKVTTHAYIAQLDKSLYVASYADYVPSLQINIDEELTADRDAFNKGLKATLVTSRSISLGGLPGIEFTSETVGGIIRSKIFLKDHRVFQVAAIVPKDIDQTKTIQTFLDSLAFTTKE